MFEGNAVRLAYVLVVMVTGKILWQTKMCIDTWGSKVHSTPHTTKVYGEMGYHRGGGSGGITV